MHADLAAKAPPDIVEEANHRIANSLALLVGLVRMQAGSLAKRERPLTNAEARLTLEGVAARICAIGQLHRMLSSAQTDGTTSLQPHLHDVTDALVASLSSPEQKLSVRHTGQDCVVLVRHLQPILLILCEIFINAMKYAHPAGVPLVMTVDCAGETDGTVRLSVSDDGVGLPEGFDPYRSRGLGLRVIRTLAEEAGGHLFIESTGLGLCFQLSLPQSAAAAANMA